LKNVFKEFDLISKDDAGLADENNRAVLEPEEITTYENTCGIRKGH